MLFTARRQRCSPHNDNVVHSKTPTLFIAKRQRCSQHDDNVLHSSCPPCLHLALGGAKVANAGAANGIDSDSRTPRRFRSWVAIQLAAAASLQGCGGLVPSNRKALQNRKRKGRHLGFCLTKLRVAIDLPSMVHLVGPFYSSIPLFILSVARTQIRSPPALGSPALAPASVRGSP
jgi:hypothetical protein